MELCLVACPPSGRRVISSKTRARVAVPCAVEVVPSLGILLPLPLGPEEAAASATVPLEIAMYTAPAGDKPEDAAPLL
uniref:Uncharacterized protein n=1 Tax=Oryza rufipogon TaxID=4529 RepID=A0A0E0PNT0_ORYRU